MSRAPFSNEVQAEMDEADINLTSHIKLLVSSIFEQILNFLDKIPFSIRAMMRILIIRSRGIENLNERIHIE